MALALRDYQSDGCLAIDFAFDLHRRVLAVAATGAGKTIVAARQTMRRLEIGQRTCFAAPRREIVAQTWAKLHYDGGIPREKLSVMMADEDGFDPDAPAQVASIDTLRSRRKRYDFDFDFIVVDEAHMNLEEIERLQQEWPRADFLLLTATPWRSEGRGLAHIADDLVVVATMPELIDRGFLCEYDGWEIDEKQQPNVKGVEDVGGDYHQGELEERSRAVLKNVFENWERWAFGVTTLAFCVGVQHSQEVAAEFRANGVTAEHVDGSTPGELRTEILGSALRGIRGRLETGETTVVTSCGVTTMGFDCPRAKCAYLLTKTKSFSKHGQQVGRVFRPFEGQRARILDGVRNCRELYAPDARLVYSLDGMVPSQIPKVRRCGKCFTLFAARFSVCPKCGTVYKPKKRGGKNGAELEREDGTLIPMVAQSGEPFLVEQRKHWNALAGVGLRHRKKKDWVVASYHRRWNQAPPLAWLEEIERAWKRV